MNLLEKVKTMFGARKSSFIEEKPKGSRDHISRDVSVALQRNEMASERAREALEDLRMSETLRSLTGKMR